MAVNSIVFGGIDSADYGIYISGEGVFNAPKRDVEMIEIPGRNGAFALDKGRFENIEVTYPAFNFEPGDYNTFAKNLSDFRNAICSLKGYQRLTDSFHPNEYRMAVYRDGLEVKPIKYNTASEFEITFDCKPQRWLISGESAVTVESGDTIINPTLFESSPLLEVEGYGQIEFNGYKINLEKIEMGEVSLWPEISNSPTNRTTYSQSQTIPTGILNTGDSFTTEAFASKVYTATVSNAPYSPVQTPSTSCTGITGATATGTTETSTPSYYKLSFILTVNVPKVSFVFGTSKTVSCQSTYSCTYDTPSQTMSYNQTISVSYDGNSTVTVTWTNSRQLMSTFNFPAADGISSVEITGNVIYVDCDFGECYLINGGEPLPLNNLIDLGSDLPTLSSGSNTITYDNTITSFKVTPRWWIV